MWRFACRPALLARRPRATEEGMVHRATEAAGLAEDRVQAVRGGWMNYFGPISRVTELVKTFRSGASLSVCGAAERCDCHASAVRKHIETLHEAGLLRIVDWRKAGSGPMFPIYEWAEPLGAADEPKPEKRTRAERRQHTLSIAGGAA